MSAAPAPPLAATSPAPTIAPSIGTTSTASPAASSPQRNSSSDSTPIVAGVFSAVAGAALIALAVVLKRRRGSSLKTRPRTPAVPATHDDDSLERRHAQPSGFFPPPYSAVAVAGGGGGNPSSRQNKTRPRRQTPPETDGADGGCIVQPSAPPPLYEHAAPSAGDTSKAAAAQSRDPGGVGEYEARGQAEPTAATASIATTSASIATTSTANLSTAEREELAEFHQRQHAGCADPVSGEPRGNDATGGGAPVTTPGADPLDSAGDIGLGQAVLVAAQELAHHCQIPGVSEAAGAVCIMANLVTDSRDNARASETRLRQCRTIVMALKRAARVADKVSWQQGLVETSDALHKEVACE